ncbi:hypothetical protein ACFL5F_02370 [Planctomycetota bacterium]
MDNEEKYQRHEHVKEKWLFGSGDFGNIKYVMKTTCSATSIISIIIRSNMDWFGTLKIGLGQRITNM